MPIELTLNLYGITGLVCLLIAFCGVVAAHARQLDRLFLISAGAGTAACAVLGVSLLI